MFNVADHRKFTSHKATTSVQPANASGRVIRQAGEHVCEPGLRIEVVELGDCDTLACEERDRVGRQPRACHGEAGNTHLPTPKVATEPPCPRHRPTFYTAAVFLLRCRRDGDVRVVVLDELGVAHARMMAAWPEPGTFVDGRQIGRTSAARLLPGAVGRALAELMARSHAGPEAQHLEVTEVGIT
jgi:hypothetical protein